MTTGVSALFLNKRSIWYTDIDTSCWSFRAVRGKMIVTSGCDRYSLVRGLTTPRFFIACCTAGLI